MDVEGGADGALEELTSFVDAVLGKYPDFAALLGSAGLGRDVKLKMIERAIAPFASELFTSLLKTLARHDRLDLIAVISAECRLIQEQRKGQKRVQVAGAVAFSESAVEQIRQRLTSHFDFEPIIETETDPSLIGGLVVRIGNTVYDSSLKTRLKQLRTRLSERSHHEIQSGRDRFSHPEGD